ncbi:hypothetical protein [Treponema sp. R6D11]
MSRTIQPRSWASLSNAGEDLNKNKPETENNRTIVLSLIDSLNNLYEKLTRLDNVMRKISTEQKLYPSNINEFNEILENHDQ